MNRLPRTVSLTLVPLLTSVPLSCSDEAPTEPEVAPALTQVAATEAASVSTEIPAITAKELCQDPTLEVLLGSLTLPPDADAIRDGLAQVVVGLDQGEYAAARESLEETQQAAEDYGGVGKLTEDDDLYLDIIDFFFDGIDELLPEEGPNKNK
jgi:hypothetical protein